MYVSVCVRLRVRVCASEAMTTLGVSGHSETW